MAAVHFAVRAHLQTGVALEGNGVFDGARFNGPEFVSCDSAGLNAGAGGVDRIGAQQAADDFGFEGGGHIDVPR
jgi:hypothetical protein